MQKTLKSLESVVTYSAMFSTFMIMGLTTVDVAGRYFLNFPILWAYEFIENYLLVATVFLGTSCAYRQGGLIRVTFFTERFSRRIQMALDMLAKLVCIILSIVFIISTMYQTPKATFAITLDVLPSGPGYLIVLLGLFVLSVVMAFDLFAGESAVMKEEPKDF